MENKVLTQEELQKLNNLRDRRNQLVSDFGVIEIQIQELELQKDTLIKSLEDLKQQEYTLGNEIQNKYGRVQINLDNGETTLLD